MGRRSPILRDVTETARWVAMIRALESERPDAHFHDPYARILAGERGAEILRRMPGARMSAWSMVVRTCVFDEMILRCVERDGADTVLNLAAGLDTRPFRLPLPSHLRWIEADLPEILARKDATLAGERPRCAREVVGVDLSDRQARRELLSRIAAASKKAVVVSEGFLIYLSEEEVAALARDLHDSRPLRWWILDLASPLVLKRLRKSFRRAMAAANASLKFAPEQGTDFFRDLGWSESEFRSIWSEGRRLRREIPMAWLARLVVGSLSAKRREAIRRMAATVLLERTSLPSWSGSAAPPAA